MQNFKFNRWLKILFITLFVVCAGIFVIHYTPSVLAANPTGGANLATGGSGLTIPNNKIISSSISKASFGTTVLAMVNYFIGFLGFLATLAFVYAGVLWVLSGGAEEPITKAKKIMTYAALGMVVVILSFSAVRFIAGSAGPSSGGFALPEPTAFGECKNNDDCKSKGTDYICTYINLSEKNKCVQAGPAGNACTDDNDCATGFSCNVSTTRCFPSDAPGALKHGASSLQGESSMPASDEGLNKIDDLLKGLGDALDITNLSDEAEKSVLKALEQGSGVNGLTNKIDALEKLLKDPNAKLTEGDRKIIEALIGALERLKILRAHLDDLKPTMPESKDIIKAYDDTSGALDDLINAPTEVSKFNRFDTKYKILKALIKAFPYVKSVIWATPSTGNVPFSVQLEGLDSKDPTGGTISDYKWTYVDKTGSEVSLGTGPVIIYEFKEVNTYAVKLRVSTSQKDADGYKTAADGVSIVRIKAYPPTSQVTFRINGKEAGDIFNVTFKEAQAGLSFDPSLTTAALGRKIEKYEWSFGDNAVESRLVPTTVVHTYEKTGEYNIKLIVTDNIGVTDKRIVKLFVKSIAADIIVSPQTGDVNTTFNFQGVASRSDDGLIQNYKWEIDDSDGKIIKESDQKTFSHKFSKPGTYNIVITVTDITGAKDRFTKTIIVNSRPPIANFNFSTPRKNHPNRIEFNAIDSYDPDEGDSIKYSWDFEGDGTFDSIDGKDALMTHEYSKIGEYRAKLQVTDAYGQHSLVDKNISIDSILSADIVSEKRAARVGEEIEFEAKSPNAVAYMWEFGDGETQSTEETKAAHTYKKVGKFAVKLNFFDEEDNSNSVTQYVLIGAGEQPVAVIDYNVNGRSPNLIEDLCKGKEGAAVSRADKIRFDARNSINTDGSSRMLSYDWKFPGGEKSSNKDSTFKFDDINKEGECFSTSLVVRDQVSGKLSEPDEVYFKVINELPELTDFVVTPPVTTGELVTPVKVQLKVVNPKDNDGTIKKYRWWYYRDGFADEKLGTNSTAMPFTDMTITSYGEPDTVNKYYFVAEVVDNDNGIYNSIERFGEMSYLDIKNGPNLSPVTDFSVDKTTVSVGDSITFSSKSYDPQGDILPTDAFRWDFDGDGEFDDVTSGPQVSRQFNTPGEYKITLKVIYRGLSSSANKTVFIEATQTLPQAAFTYSVEGNDVTFDAGNSRFDPSLADKTLRYEWDFDVATDANGNGVKDDDVQATEMKTTFTYTEKGLYKVKLKIKDMLGMEGIVVRDVNLNLTEAERQKNSYRSLKVTAPKYPMTTLDLEIIPVNLQKNESADVNVQVLNADGTPYTGKVFFEIKDGSGQFTPNPVTAVGSKASSIFTATDVGKVRVRVRATRTIHGEMREEAIITVK